MTGSGFAVSMFRRCSHCPAKLATSASDRGSASMRLHLLLQHGGVLQSASLRKLEQLIVGNAAPQEERQPRGQLEIADRVGLARRRARAGSCSTRNRKSGETSIASSAF